MAQILHASLNQHRPIRESPMSQPVGLLVLLGARVREHDKKLSRLMPGIACADRFGRFA